ncbi:hypothetical protein ElyMa_001756000 [Elysia marginata]|uniref:Ig-like domain-containing protein n=1 Tax=Elysia marginata TaxID=1093978 RepID=A0AAV4EB73_9GAST|nr:hypothetical protein ElyMa_001756000 [Elysia marginata]
MVQDVRSEPTCGPVEEGQSTTLACDVHTAGCSEEIVAAWQAEETGSTELVSCNSNVCGGIYSSYFPTTISSTRSTLTISSVSRVTPFNMETKWSCSECSRGYRTVCDKLQVYTKPQNPSCTLSENTGSGDITSVTVRCSTSKVYPEAKCIIYKKINYQKERQSADSEDSSLPGDNHDPPFLVTEQKTRHALTRLDVNKAAEPDNIKPRLLKTCSNQLASIFTFFN